MKDLLFATSNLNKARELEGLTAGLPTGDRHYISGKRPN